ncbi:MAG: penicillin-binding protein 2 [Alphaproteobacteria bacterium]|nr:penicillin-binding protein 2 [Alphaproteobacteria bacterium]
MTRAERITLDGAAKAAMERTRSRLNIAIIGFGVVFAVLFGRLVEVTMLREGPGPKTARVESDASYYRADLVDRSGEILATDLQAASLYADARVVWDPAEAAQSLAGVLPGVDAAVLTKRLATRQAFVWIKRNVPPRQQEAVRQLGIPGLHFRNEPRRVYPNGRTAAHVMGYVNVDNHGLAGVERGVEDLILERRNRGGVVELSLDLRVQHALQDELADAVARFKAHSASGIVLDVNNGEVLALASLPDFDPNEPGEAAKAALFNNATLGVYEMGSTFKTFTTAMALDTQKVTFATQFDATNPITVGRFTISDFHPENRLLTVPEIFVHSSNIGTAKIALEVGTTTQKAYLAKLGLLAPVPSEIKEAGAPIVPKRWGDLETMTVSYGHGIAITPLHVAAASAALVNGGKLFKPTLLKREAGVVVPFTRVVSEQTSGQMRELLRMAVTQGTGSKADVEGYPVAGKTGTAEKATGGNYAPKRLLSSFVGVFPARNPLYLVLVVLDEPQGSDATDGYATAGWTAAPTAGKVIARIAPMLNVPVTPTEPQGPPTTMASYEDLR